MSCPCGSQRDYGECCEPLHAMTALPESAEQLMRSRFASFYLKKVDYIIATTVPVQQDLLDKSALQAWADTMNWTHLTVISHNKVGKRHAQVHFKAYFDNDGQQGIHDERSAFVKVGERWYFLDPTLPVNLTGKQPCLCGSHEKFKACCGRFLA
ncbi:MAG: YchJ family protein [Moraxella sp.]|uniref:YchJ family protein n=1 Tax=Moraxella sp. TaxID=479 RepID=UPI0026DBE8E3|nr:YchJ family protein [Moraxella sp.]MDO4450441.1 YchJ family protein [Moraxella sp.]